MSKTPTQKFWASATVIFTITTALTLLTAVWFFDPDGSRIIARLIMTSITLAALSFVFFLVATFSKK
ncbi:MAG: hypothetical protein K9L85_03580 [Candidatus Peribacteraceae bacterium]|nr:hypothetical protein [Candidatus Peribacteraceae bacterium]